MTSTLLDSRVAAALTRMFAEADAQMPMLGEMFGKDVVPAESSAQERADALSEFYLPVTPEAGRLLYTLVRASRPTTVVEFGMSLGISAIHLASAVRDNGEGRVVTTELNETKVAVASGNFADAGLDDLITVLHGDALQTLASIDGPVQFVLLDGWKDLYVQVLAAARAAAGARGAGRRRQHQHAGVAALPRLHARPRQRLRERALPGQGFRQHGDLVPGVITSPVRR